MDDLNLIPQELKTAAELKKRRTGIAIIIIIIAVIVVIVSCIPTYLRYKMSLQNENIEKEILKLSFVTDEINKLNIQRKTIEDRMKVLDTISKKEQKWTDFIKNVSSITPDDISFNILNISGEGMSLQGSSANIEAIAVFIGNLENSNRYTDINLNDINPDDKKNTMTFNLTFKLISGESKVK